MREGIRLAGDLDGASGLQAAKAKLLEEDEEPPLPRKRRSRVVFWEVAAGIAELDPCADETIPGADDCLVQREVRQVVVLGTHATEIPVTLRYPLQEVGRQETALGADRLKEAAGAAHADGT